MPNVRTDVSESLDAYPPTVLMDVQYIEGVGSRHPTIEPCTIPTGASRDVGFGLMDMIQRVLHASPLEAPQLDKWNKVKVHVATVDIMGVSIIRNPLRYVMT